MKKIFKKRILSIISLLVVVAILINWYVMPHRVDFSSEVKPLFNKKCISCHGGVKKDGGFSLLFEHEAMDTTESGKPAIIPGKPELSEMIRRIKSSDPEERMPYKHEPLSEEEIGLLSRWIQQGAKWGEHWAYVPVKKVVVPNVAPTFKKLFSSVNGWVVNEVDHFIYDALKKQKLQPTQIADKATLLRRVSMDITGMPAPKGIAEWYMKEETPEAYEQLVDTLLASNHYGERWTALWLDLARYADSKGYEKDSYRNIWRYRDWLIKAFNKDMPYDQFITEQLAGDLLPNVTDEQFIATAYHRNTVTNDEGGSDNEEFRVAAVMDRVNTTWETLMGTTFACVQCHSHPYDPFTHEEYFKFLAFFNNTRDEDAIDEYPLFREYRGEDSVKYLALRSWIDEHAEEEKKKELVTFLKTGQPAINSLVANKFYRSEISLSEYLSMSNLARCRLATVNLQQKTKLLYRYRSYSQNSTWNIYADSIGGKLLSSVKLEPSSSWKVAEANIEPTEGMRELYFSLNDPGIDKANESYIAYFDWFYFTSDFPGSKEPDYEKMHGTFLELAGSRRFVATPIMMENPPDMARKTNVFVRGNWLEKGDEVQPGTPASLNPFPDDAPRNRLGLAMWLTAKENPLTARTLVNRIWEQMMGLGIAETLEDIGTQGINPTHQHLLDWLSWQLMHEYKWSMKKLIRTIALSATYRQSSEASDEKLEADPFNKYYARGPRVRLTAEQIRDQGLAVSGLLSTKLYGPSVMPYQPEGIWLSPYAGRNAWVKSRGDDQYRRAIYTHWKRAAPYPSMISFDGVAREVCQARRIRTNTPLQALALLNDSAYLEMARSYAARMLETSGDAKQQISNGYKMAMYKEITPEKLNSLEELYLQIKIEFSKERESAKDIIEDGEDDDPGRAALIVVANAMLNLDELITKN